MRLPRRATRLIAAAAVTAVVAGCGPGSVRGSATEPTADVVGEDLVAAADALAARGASFAATIDLDLSAVDAARLLAADPTGLLSPADLAAWPTTVSGVTTAEGELSAELTDGELTWLEVRVGAAPGDGDLAGPAAAVRVQALHLLRRFGDRVDAPDPTTAASIDLTGPLGNALANARWVAVPRPLPGRLAHLPGAVTGVLPRLAAHGTGRVEDGVLTRLTVDLADVVGTLGAPSLREVADVLATRDPASVAQLTVRFGPPPAAGVDLRPPRATTVDAEDLERFVTSAAELLAPR